MNPKLLAQVNEIADLSAALALLEWDQQVNLPAAGGAGRAAQMSALTGVIHRKSTSKAFGALIAELEAERSEKGSFEYALCRKLRRDYDKETRLPARLVTALAETSAVCFDAWLTARGKRDFSILAPSLEKLLKLKREEAGCLHSGGHPLDGLLDCFDEGNTVAELEGLFGILGREQSVILKILAARKQESGDFLKRSFAPGRQLKFAKAIVTKTGYDFRGGRLDLAEHPFSSTFGPGDSRITTNVKRNELISTLLSTVHEAGHAIYEQGIAPEYLRTPLGTGCSYAFHESQSRLWENFVGRSLPFWQYFYPQLQRSFKSELEGVSLERFYRAINQVEPSFIRTEADEVSYNLHVIVRFELEKGLFERSIEVKDLPGLWNEKMRQYLGVVPPDDLAGVLQDVHWPSGAFGYFPSYAMGNVISAQIWEKANEALPELENEIAAGNFTPLRNYLKENVHRYGSALTPQELLRKITGSSVLDPVPFLNYLKRKYSV